MTPSWLVAILPAAVTRAAGQGSGHPVPALDSMSSQPSSDDRSVNSPWGGPSQRGLRIRKRHDHGADLFRAALDHVDDPDRLRHALFELSRTYDPVTNGPLLAAEVRHRILELAGQGGPDEARRLLETVLASYIQTGQPPPPGGVGPVGPEGTTGCPQGS